LLGFEVENAARLGDLHQLRIDAYGAQHAGEHTPAIGTIVPLNGLYMFLEPAAAISIYGPRTGSWPIPASGGPGSCRPTASAG
jgi:hypothetical protein